MKKLNIQYFAFLTLVSMLATTGCRKDVDDFVVYESSIALIGQTIRGEVPAEPTVFKMSSPLPTDTILQTPSGVRIWLTDTDRLFEDATGLDHPFSACSTAEVEITEARQYSQLVGHELSLTSDGQLLETGGMVNIKIICDGLEMRLRPGEYLKVQLPVASPADFKSNMKVYYGQMADDVVGNWKASSQEVYQDFWTANNDTLYAYQLICKNLGWVGCNRVFSEPKTDFCVTLPETCNGQNTIVFLLLPSLRTAVKMGGDKKAGEFCFANAPLGYNAKVVSVTNIGSQWQIGSTDVVVGNSPAEIFPTHATKTEVVAYLQSL